MRIPFDLDALMARRGIRYGTYAGFYLFCLLLFAYWSFPYERLRDHLINRVEYSSGPGGRQPSGWELDIVELSPSWGTGVTLTGVRLTRAPETPDEAPVSMAVDEVTVRISPLARLFGTTSVRFHAAVGDGVLEGALQSSDEHSRLSAKASDLNLRKLPFVRATLGIPLTGTLNGTLDFSVAEEAEESTGHADLSIQKLVLGDGKAKLKIQDMQDGLTIERIDAGDLQLKIDSDRGVARIAQLASSGKDAEVTGSGTVRLAQPMGRSRLDLLLRVKFSDEYRNRSDQTRALFSLMEFNPKVREARASDGALQFRLAGTFGGRMTPTPAGRAAIGKN
jgi:type II secretion system protein N